MSDDLLPQIVKTLHHDWLLGKPFGDAYSEALLAAAVHRLTKLAGAAEVRECGHAASIRRAVELIATCCHENLTLQSIADAAQYPGDLYSFIRYFKKVTGSSPHQFLVNERLERARNLIISRKCSITEAALRCGFASGSHFSTVFKKRWGVPPSCLIRKSH
ncbi:MULTISPECIES: helix-turn-helix domain-containing protein [Burkholderia]|uniref:helix-turn-helix domain-containing protein n=1 Tax=Burkholderia TaxID=32008 RepID=UPI0013F4CD81|nr:MULTISPECIES: AraC family transcriptional regulator [Burkholderia]